MMRSAPHAATTAVPTDQDRARVLLVEDDEGDAFLVRELLGEVAPELDLVHAVSLADAEGIVGQVDCALLDLGLPDTVGLEGLARLRRAAPDIAVLVLTGQDDLHRGIEAVAAGAQDYLVKGHVDGERLARAIRYAMVRRRAEQAERALLEAELLAQEAGRLERGLLPTALLRDPTTSIAAGYRPGRRRAVLGGDFYDAVELDDGSIHIAIGDVCGHGADEAALGVALRIAWRALTLARRPPAELFQTLEQVLVAERHHPDIFTTLAVITVAPDRRSADLWLAGHPAPVLVHPGPPAELAADSVHPPLGLASGREWVATRVELPPEWTLLLFTDGLIEGRTGDGAERLGVPGLAAAVQRLTDRMPDWPAAPDPLLQDLIAHVDELNGGRHADDVAALLVSSRGHGAA